MTPIQHANAVREALLRVIDLTKSARDAGVLVQWDMRPDDKGHLVLHNFTAFSTMKLDN